MRNEALYQRVVEIIRASPGATRGELSKQLKAEGFYPTKFLNEISGSLGCVLRALHEENKITSIKITASSPAEHFIKEES